MSILTLIAILAFGFAVGYTVGYRRYRVQGDSMIHVNTKVTERKKRGTNYE